MRFRHRLLDRLEGGGSERDECSIPKEFCEVTLCISKGVLTGFFEHHGMCSSLFSVSIKHS